MTDEETPFEPLDGSEELKLLQAFASRGVRAIVFGGYAVRLHGDNTDRDPGDLDLVVDCAPDNLDRFQKALVDLGIADDRAATASTGLMEGKKINWRNAYDHHADLVSKMGSFSFAELAQDAVQASHAHLQLSVVSKDHLIASKRAALESADRPADKKGRDRADLAILSKAGTSPGAH
jgi:hypothetical protein